MIGSSMCVISAPFQNITRGVPQVSVLGSMLFLTYVNDIPTTMNTPK